MTLHRISLLTLFVLVFLALPAHAEQGWYIQAQGGVTSTLASSNGSNTAGAFDNGQAEGTEIKGGSLWSVAGGYRISDLWRTDLSYTDLSGDAKWDGRFGGAATPETSYNADWESRVLLLNLYLHGKGLAPETFSRFDPFIGVGIGVAYNHLSGIEEIIIATGNHYADIEDAWELNPAARVGIGLDIDLGAGFIATMSADSYWLGQFQSGGSRRKPATQAIGAWTIDDATVFGVSMGLRYQF